jgi:type II secretory pathway component PulJ
MQVRPAETRAPDAGFTLLDVIMSMTVMGIVTAICTTAIISMYRTANADDAKAVAQAQLATAMRRIDKEIRYAKGIGRTGTGAAASVDFLAVQGTSKICFQLRVQDRKLWQRTWSYGSAPSGSGWVVLASGITSTTPFSYAGPTDRLGYQQLDVFLKTDQDEQRTTFTALNTDRTSGNDYCAAGRSTP